MEIYNSREFQVCWANWKIMVQYYGGFEREIYTLWKKSIGSVFYNFLALKIVGIELILDFLNR